MRIPTVMRVHTALIFTVIRNSNNTAGCCLKHSPLETFIKQPPGTFPAAKKAQWPDFCQSYAECIAAFAMLPPTVSNYPSIPFTKACRRLAFRTENVQCPGCSTTIFVAVHLNWPNSLPSTDPSRVCFNLWGGNADLAIVMSQSELLCPCNKTQHNPTLLFKLKSVSIQIR